MEFFIPSIECYAIGLALICIGTLTIASTFYFIVPNFTAYWTGAAINILGLITLFLAYKLEQSKSMVTST